MRASSPLRASDCNTPMLNAAERMPPPDSASPTSGASGGTEPVAARRSRIHADSALFDGGEVRAVVAACAAPRRHSQSSPAQPALRRLIVGRRLRQIAMNLEVLDERVAFVVGELGPDDAAAATDSPSGSCRCFAQVAASAANAWPGVVVARDAWCRARSRRRRRRHRASVTKPTCTGIVLAPADEELRVALRAAATASGTAWAPSRCAGTARVAHTPSSGRGL